MTARDVLSGDDMTHVCELFSHSLLCFSAALRRYTCDIHTMPVSPHHTGTYLRILLSNHHHQNVRQKNSPAASKN